eukprot:GHVQ01005950.1.p1 GENE.GHVQ01005950.1~~GHVQ01005950.1.p1  ORF type:complete len:104 (+),score=15.07 GHVQ01005950.1:703-1014(+)
MADAGGLTIPPKCENLRKEEEQALHGADLRVNIKLPDGKMEVMQIKSSTEVGYVKLLLAQKFGIPVRQVQLVHQNTPLIDPMSFCDHPKVNPPEIEVDCFIKE